MRVVTVSVLYFPAKSTDDVEVHAAMVERRAESEESKLLGINRLLLYEQI